MPNYIIYDPLSSPVAGLVLRIVRSWPDEKESDLGNNRIKDPNLLGVDTTKMMKWTGAAVVNLTQEEIDSITSAVTSANLAGLKAAAKSIFVNPVDAKDKAISLGFESLMEVVLSELNIVRGNFSPALVARTINQFRTSFKNTYESKIDALSS